MCCIIGSTTHTGHFFPLKQQNCSRWLVMEGERLIELKMFSRYDFNTIQCTMYNIHCSVHNVQLATQRSKFYWQQMSPEPGRPKPKQNCWRDEKYKFNVYNDLLKDCDRAPNLPNVMHNSNISHVLVFLLRLCL